VFLAALPAASIVGGPASGWILDHVHAYGLSSWRWLLILEGLPAIVCGLLTYRWLPDRPADVTFLTQTEKVRLAEVLGAEAGAKGGAHARTVLKTLTHPRVLHLAATHFLFLTGLYLTGFWMPQSIKGVATNLSNTTVGILIVIPNVAGLLSMVLVARHSDRSGERHFHTLVPLLFAAVALYLVGGTSSVTVCVSLWCIAAAGLDSYLGPFWTLPGVFLSGRSAACGFAFINSVGSLGAYFGLSLIGTIASGSGGFSEGFRLVSAALVCAAVLIVALKLHTDRARAPDATQRQAV
jgi:MFS transporter, ACS family, tartrate transporter